MFASIEIFGLSSCVGVSDWEYELPNGYFVSRINATNICICHLENEQYSMYTVVIDKYITCFSYNDTYICARRLEVELQAKPEEILNMDFDEAWYCILNAGTGEVYDSLTEEEYDKLIEELNITNLCDWIGTDKKPEGAYSLKWE